MTLPALDKLQVLVTGVNAAIARDVVRLVVAEGASVVAADRDGGKLSRLDVEVGLCRTRVATAAVDVSNPGEVRLWQESLAAPGRRPHLMICCCGAPARGAGRGAHALPGDVTLSEHAPPHCPGARGSRRGGL